MNSNILIHTNVICEEVSNEEGSAVASTSDDRIVKRIDYWELLGLTENHCMRFSSMLLRDRNLTEKQRRQRDAFIREATRQIWPAFSNVQSMPSTGSIIARQVEAKSVAQPSADTPAMDSDHDAPAAILFPNPPSADDDDFLRQRIVEAEPSACLVVTAPPGTGKTHMLVDRLCSLVQRSSPDSPREAITVLSF